jgi:hypothetical protein
MRTTSLFVLASTAAATTNNYVGAADGTWFASEDNWSQSSFPSYPQTVTASKAMSLSKNTNGAARLLVISDSFTVAGGVLEIAPTTCDATQYQPSDGAPTASADRVCLDITVCGAVGVEWEESPRTATVHRVCLPVQTCTDDEYETQAPSATQDRICKSHTPCPRSQYESKVPEWNQDRECSALRHCTTTEWMTKKPVDDGVQFTANRECQQHASCDTTTHTETVAAIGGNDGSRDQHCEEKVHCQMGTWGSYTPCTKTCGSGTQTRTRQIDVHMEYDGTPCNSHDHDTHTTDSALCNESCCPGFVQQDSSGAAAANAHTTGYKRINQDLTVEVVSFIGAKLGTPTEICEARYGFRLCTSHEATYLDTIDSDAIHCCGQRAAAVCAQCQPGGFSKWAGMGTCPSCGVGTWSPRGAVECTDCVHGTEQGSTGATTVTACKQCQPGHWSHAAAEACTACAAGYENSNKGSTSIAACTKCAKGFTNPTAGEDSCVECQSGEYQDDLGSETCKKCDAGTHQPANAATSSGECLSCGFGEWSPQASSICVSCVKGTASAKPEAGSIEDCATCPAGSWSAEKAKTCTSCAKGYFQASPGQDMCQPCPAGTYLNAEGGDHADDCTACPVGHYCPSASPTPIACDAGYEQGSTHATKASDCIECLAGWHAAGTGNEQCTGCGIGTYQNTPGAADCKSCDAGHAQPLEKRTSVTDCEFCAAGRYQPHDHRSFCVTCGTGFYQNIDGQTGCKKCAAGSYGYATGDKTSESEGCKVCQTGRYQPDEGTSGCIRCAVGKFNGATGSVEANTCTHCEWGHYADELGMATCKSCAAGHFGDTTKAKGMFAHCIHCPHGQYQEYDGSTKCETCAAGSFTGVANCNADNSQCTFTPSTGNPTCTTCPSVDALRIWTSDSGAKSCVKKQMACEMNAWGGWSNPAGFATLAPGTGTCSLKCRDEGGWDAGTYISRKPAGRQQRTRTAKVQLPCGLTDQSKCAWSWGFDGDQSDIEQCDTYPSNGPDAYNDDQTCNEHYCPRDCTVTPWASWSTCTKACGKGATSRSRTIAHQAANTGSCNDHFKEDADCNDITCEWPMCHDKHIKCEVVEKTFTGCDTVRECGADLQSTNKCSLWSDYDSAKGTNSCHKCSSIAECAIEGVHKTIVVQHVRDHMCPGCTRAGSNGHEAVYEQNEGPASALRNMFNCSFTTKADACECRCKMHPPCAGRLGSDLSNELLLGNHWFNIADRQTCCNMCTNHADCDSFSFTADGQCKLFKGSAVYTTGAATTFSGCRSGDTC